MVLKSFKYSTTGWSLDTLTLGEANLIVGKNSSGKSRALKALSNVTSVLSQHNSSDNQLIFNSELILTNVNGDEIFISLAILGKKILKESLIVNNETIIDRTETSAIFLNETANPPEDMLLMQVRRDVQKYPVIEEIIKWANESIVLSFIKSDSYNEEELHDIISEFTPKMKKHLLKMANDIGFPLTLLDTFDNYFYGPKKKGAENNSELTTIKVILLKEENVGTILFFDNLSSGMYRTISLLILIEQLINLKHPALIAIDDLGEGLDYSRATKVGKLLFDMCKKHNIQLIATSNEEFMMNIVDIDQWNILVRNGEKVRSITSALCPKEFEEFKFSGLSNFDFFTSDFLRRVSGKLFDSES